MAASNTELTPKGFLKSVSIIHMALIAGLVMFGLTAFLIKGRSAPDNRNANDAFTYLVPLLAVIGLTAGNLIFKQQIAKLSEQSSLKEKIKTYQGALITRFALLEGPALFGLVAYILDRNLLFLLISGLLILYFIYLRPSREKAESDLQLSYDQKLAFERENDIIG